jgi:hypothetical protein
LQIFLEVLKIGPLFPVEIGGKLSKPALKNGQPDALHQVEIVIEVMDGV